MTVIKRKRKRYCTCGCGIELVDGRGQFATKKCPYRYYKKQVKEGKKQPDYFTKCTICGGWFPCWFFRHSSKPPKTCSAASCRGTKQKDSIKQHYIDFAEIKKRQRAEAKKAGYHYEKAKIAGSEYCSGAAHKGPQCKNYSTCTDTIFINGLIFVKYFETEGKCYEYPDEWSGWRYEY